MLGRSRRFAMMVLTGLAVSGFGMPAIAAPQRPPAVEAVLLRGLFNVFSLGMDELAAKLARAGVRTDVSNHTAWPAIADRLIRERRDGRGARRLVLIGHSLGGNDVFHLAARLAEAGIAVDLLAPIDATAPSTPPPNVRRVVNYYQSDNGWGAPVPTQGSRVAVVNADVATNRRDLYDPQMGHTSIDKSDLIHREIVAMARALARSGR